MESFEALKQETRTLVKRAWVNLGMPFDLSMIEEKVEGIIDVEPLIITTLLIMEKDRMATDLPLWVSRFSNLINFQKLKTIFKGLPEKLRRLAMANLKQVKLGATSKLFANVFDLRTAAMELPDETSVLRAGKINTIENAAQMSLFIKNRLLYGTGFRADLISLTHIKSMNMKGTNLATLLCANNSTISRILSGLKACGFLNQDKERVEPFEVYSGMFISSLSVWNLCEMMDATKFAFQELKNGLLSGMNFNHDAIGRRIHKKLKWGL